MSIPDTSVDPTAAHCAADWLLAESVAPQVQGDPLQPLYDFAAHGVLAMPFCAHCDLALELEQQRCDGCGALEVLWREVEAVGKVHAATMMHRHERGLVVAERPYPIVDVELASGHRIVVTTATPCPAAPPIGTKVFLSFRRLGATTIPAIEYSKGSS
ncbi:OB-fold domain-containing protein [Mycobacterium sp. E342]|uniref:OB-fold domain-containing protein n=1 Tax=Mycobacterium sp. E342 TaxID=1834147 RepID=UPI000AD48446|nr:OB-fold domain-containing protein [Mycobacterium sp. E342]